MFVIEVFKILLFCSDFNEVSAVLPLNMFVSCNCSRNKTAGNNQHIFRTLLLLKIPLTRMRMFSRKYHISLQIQKFFDFSDKPSIQLEKKDLLNEIVSFDTHSTEILALYRFWKIRVKEGNKVRTFREVSFSFHSKYPGIW